MAYKVILNGYDKTNTKGTYYIEVDAAEILQMDRKELKGILENPPHTIKDDLEKEDAEKLEERLNQAGVKCEVEHVRFDLSKFSLVED
ncbi:ribosomal protein L7/L12 [Kangiella sp. TOML190]|uniref:ribosomal protein L7/L12 n=1 Tax=Kangiella sp. TOML190 TaxID=2931351 RepID=UPI00203D3668|nr:ribosomal protein L7/L12 [Kangiella sp. TOML190]